MLVPAALGGGEGIDDGFGGSSGRVAGAVGVGAVGVGAALGSTLVSGLLGVSTGLGSACVKYTTAAPTAARPTSNPTHSFERDCEAPR